jgi:hypothetical protein
MEELKGGREGLVFRAENKVYRPSGFWSVSVHQLLSHLENVGFENAPKSYGFEGSSFVESDFENKGPGTNSLHDNGCENRGNEILSYVQGEVYNYPLRGNIATIQALVSAGKLLREYHDATVSFIASRAFDESQWMLPSRLPYEVICHGDFAPYNVALIDKKTVGIFDFDTAHPAPRLWDVAYALYCWAPFKTDSVDCLGNLAEQVSRAKQFSDAYGLSTTQRQKIVNTMIQRIKNLVDYMQSEAAKGHAGFIENISNGHHLAYLADIDYLKMNQRVITASLRASAL